MTNSIENFYNAFKNLDAETMVSYYHKDIEFQDPAFGKLQGERAKNMWRMLCASQKEKQNAFTISFSEIKLKDNNGSAKWEAVYNFSQTGRKVHNCISAKFIIKDGLIIKHTDTFNLHKWAKQALGFKGLLLGGTSFFKKKLNKQTNKMLDAFSAEDKI